VDEWDRWYLKVLDDRMLMLGVDKCNRWYLKVDGIDGTC